MDIGAQTLLSLFAAFLGMYAANWIESGAARALQPMPIRDAGIAHQELTF